VVKYFLHGILFSGLLIVLLVGWAALTLVLVVCGAWLGLILAVVLLVAMIGWLNTIITATLWFEVETGVGQYLAHGLLLLIVLLVASLGPRAVDLFVPGIGTTILMFFVWAPVDGYLAKRIAGIWRRYPILSSEAPAHGSPTESPPRGDERSL